jgi:hypothetical protein
MKKLIILITLVVFASAAFAGGKSEGSSKGGSSSSSSGQSAQNVPISYPQSVPKTGSSCDIRANNNAYTAGYNMISQSGQLISYNTMTVNQIYSQCYSSGRSQTPLQPAGLAFYGVTPGSSATKTHVEFYTYSGGPTYSISANDGYMDRGTESRPAANPSQKYTFVQLLLLPRK